MPSPRSRRFPTVVGLLLCLVAGRRPSCAQGLPATPVSLLDNRLTIAGSVAVSAGPGDDRAYYNLTTYDASLLRLVQLSLDASFRLGDRAALVLALNGQTPIDAWRWRGYPSTVFLSVRPWTRRTLTVRAGIVPPAFGAFLQRGYGRGNLLIGYPLAYHYATTVRMDAFPSTADELLRRRAFGAVVRYRLGKAGAGPGLPLVNPFGWNAGLGASARRGPITGTVALTRGGIASGRDAVSHTGWQVSGRGQAAVGPGLVLGVSAARGPYVERDFDSLLQTAAFNRSPRETAFGMDAEYSRGYWLVRAEAIVNRRSVPAFQPPYLEKPLGARWAGVEARYKILPGLYLAARLERLSFSRVAASAGETSWDANVTRVEAGGGYTLSRNVMAKLSYQHNRRDSSWYPRQRLVAAQVVLWF